MRIRIWLLLLFLLLASGGLTAILLFSWGNHSSTATSGSGARDAIFLLDIRPKRAWDSQGHIEGAVRIEWRKLGQRENLDLLPHDKLIAVIDEQGQHAGQVTPILRMLGYDAVTLRSGMTSWTQTPEGEETIRAMEAADFPVVR